MSALIIDTNAYSGFLQGVSSAVKVLRTAHEIHLPLIVLAELLAVRTIVLNLHFALASGDTPTVEAMQRLIDRADRDKLGKAQERLTVTAARGPR